MTSVVADEVIATFARRQNDWMTRVLKGSLDPEEVARVVQVVIDRGGFIAVDRTIRPLYPEWVKEVIYLELEVAGPESYDVGTLTQWLHDNQKTGVVTGNVIHEHLKNNNMLESCVGLRDLEEIQKKGINFFRRYFQGKAVFGWKSVVRDSGGSLSVPYLIEVGSEVLLGWSWIGNDWSSDDPALRFAS